MHYYYSIYSTAACEEMRFKRRDIQGYNFIIVDNVIRGLIQPPHDCMYVESEKKKRYSSPTLKK